MLKGNSAPACEPEYKFISEDGKSFGALLDFINERCEDSNRFQQLVHGRRLLFDHSLNVKSIKSKAGDESGASVLRLWKDSLDESDASLWSHSLMYFNNTAKDPARHQPEEVYCTQD
jgi:hypothetical protein